VKWHEVIGSEQGSDGSIEGSVIPRKDLIE